MSDPLDQIDDLLSQALAGGWDDPTPAPEPAAPVEPPAPRAQSNENWKVVHHEYPPLVETPKTAPATEGEGVLLEYPPLPVRDALPAVVKPKRGRVGKEEAKEMARQAMTEAGIEHDVDEPPPDDQERHRGLLDIGLLSDLATGKKTALEAAEAAGITTAEVHSSLATALRDVDPKEIAKAMGIQAAEQQLKSGALYGVVLSELVNDMLNGRLSPMAKLDLAKLLANVGKIMPKEDKNVAAGGGFVLNISMGGAPQPITIEAE